MRKMEEQITYQESSGSTSSADSPLPPRFLSPPLLPSLPTLSSPASTPPLLPPPSSLALLHRTAVYERVSWVWLHCSVEKGRAAVLVRCAEGWCTRRNAFTRCVDFCLHALLMLRVWHIETLYLEVFSADIHHVDETARCVIVMWHVFIFTGLSQCFYMSAVQCETTSFCVFI